MSEPVSASSSSQGAAAGGKKVKQNKRPSPEEIEAKRRERAAKKEKEAADKVAKEAELAAAIAANGKIPNGHLDEHGNVLFVPRDWAHVSQARENSASAKQKVRVVSWNILAQGLVRRTLFPGSDCLKFKDRSVGLTAEFSSRTGHGWDVGCFQEVDRMDVHGETLDKDGFSYVYEKGYRQKQHGLLVAWRRDLFGESAHKRMTIDLDAESVSAPSEPIRTACSRVTRNVGLFVALTLRDSATGDAGAKPGIIVATTHLFWHPMHAYERARQSGILVRRLHEFRKELGAEWQDAPCILAGDFNDQPHSATYHLLAGRELTPHCHGEVSMSSVVHKSIDERRERGGVSVGFAEGTTEVARNLPSTKSVAPSTDSAAVEEQDQQNAEEDAEEQGEEGEGEEEEAEEEGGEPDDRMLKNCRAATEEDALLSMDELLQLHDVSRPRPGSARAQGDSGEATSAHLGSAYGLHYGHMSDPSEDGNFFGSPERGRERWDDPDWTPETPNCHTGDSTEPMWTIFSSLFCLTLDYIFMLPKVETSTEARAAPSYPTVTRLLRTHRTETLQPGVPRKGVCASDHIAIGAEIEL
ncbi:endonuclease/exonuclease/phosphatase [Moesziomyces antarcticus]|uniref:Endonuclease/exonuclease/phosphatase n=2 Tax=Pseudozyma antarctica TaxID=84753 RepID=A0A081CC11_PSEA2|nr:endonuclease/exonuclease/phosphatase [Moesziomyces antarcticus]GAK64207.1 endonuclease/exonuclease/phosphatase [Moesziomyces antarcticus]SPO44568.1 related to NGL3 - putative endonuclease [Moesziomyces antarcticus]